MILMIVIPVSLPLISRRSLVVLMPVALILIIHRIADRRCAAPDGAVFNRAFVASPPVLATLVLVIWVFLSLIWTPYLDRP